MKKINKSLSKNYTTSRLFLEDFEAIEQLISSPNREYKIEVGDYEYKNIEELKKRFQNQKLNQIRIVSLNPYICIELNKMWVSLFSVNDDLESAGLFYKLDKILSETTRKPNFIYSYYTIWSVNIFLYLIPVNSSLYANNVTFRYIGAFFLIWILWVIYIRLFNSGQVILAKKHDVDNFFKRNKDTLIVGIFTTLLTVILTTYFPAIQETLRTVTRQ